MTTSLYILQLSSGKYYIGKTNRDVEERINEHYKGGGCKWTTLYKPVKLIKIIQNPGEFDEDKHTKIYMKKYGIDNVRGGSYTEEILSDSVKKILQKEICTASNTCFRCNRRGHFANNCFAKTKLDGSTINYDSHEYWYVGIFVMLVCWYIGIFTF